MADKRYMKNPPRSLRMTPEPATPKATIPSSPKVPAQSAQPKQATSPTRMDTLTALHVDIGLQRLGLIALRAEMLIHAVKLMDLNLDTAHGQLTLLGSLVPAMQATLGKLSTNGG